MSIANYLGKGIALSLSLLGLVACIGSGKNRFVTEGNISGAKGQSLYLEEVGTGNVLSLDSTKLDETGYFRFSYEGTSYPMFYRLRLGEASIPFAADSSTHIIIEADGDHLFTSYNLREAEPYNHKIREISHLRLITDRKIDSLVAAFRSGQITQSQASTLVDSLAQDFKRNLATHYIYVDPKSPAAYYALFQQKEGSPYFSPQDQGDVRAFAAVATAYDTFYPQAPYTPFLKNIALEALKTHKQRKAVERGLTGASDSLSIRTLNYPDLKLRDSKGQWQRLSDWANQGTVLLSFTDYRGTYSPGLVTSLRKLQEQRPNLSIYEVALDEDLYHWRNATRNLPWVCVRDEAGTSAQTYNVQVLPTLFLIQRGEIKRIQSLDELLQP